jgi:hypothetical protein
MFQVGKAVFGQFSESAETACQLFLSVRSIYLSSDDDNGSDQPFCIPVYSGPQLTFWALQAQ